MTKQEVDLYRIITTYFNYKLITQNPMISYIDVIKDNIKLVDTINIHYDKMNNIMRKFNVGDKYKQDFYEKTIKHLYYHVDKYIGEHYASKN